MSGIILSPFNFVQEAKISKQRDAVIQQGKYKQI